MIWMNRLRDGDNVKLQLQDQYKTLGKNVAETRLEQMQAQMASFKEHLEDFALKHRWLSVVPSKRMCPDNQRHFFDKMGAAYQV